MADHHVSVGKKFFMGKPGIQGMYGILNLTDEDRAIWKSYDWLLHG